MHLFSCCVLQWILVHIYICIYHEFCVICEMPLSSLMSEFIFQLMHMRIYTLFLFNSRGTYVECSKITKFVSLIYCGITSLFNCVLPQ
jgi:hypothetical protein